MNEATRLTRDLVAILLVKGRIGHGFMKLPDPRFEVLDPRWDGLQLLALLEVQLFRSFRRAAG